MKALICLVVVWFARAETADTAIEALERAQKSIRLAPNTGCTTCDATREGAENPLWSQCFAAVCPEGHGQLHEELAKAAARAKTGSDPDFDRALARAVRDLVAARLNSVREIRKAIATDRTLEDPNARRLLRLHRINRPDAPVTPETARLVATLTKKIRVISNLGPLDEPYGSISTRKSPAELASLLAAARERLVELDAKLREKTGVRNLHNESALAESTGDVTAEAYESIRAALRTTRVAQFVVDSPAFDQRGRMRLREFFGPADPELARQETLLRRYADPDVKFGEDPIGLAVRREIENCTSGYHANRYFAADAKRIDEFRRNIPKIRDGVLAGLGARISAESSKSLGELSKEWRYDLPPDGRSQSRNFLAKLESTARTARATTRIEEGEDPSSEFRLVSWHLAETDSATALSKKLALACAAFRTAPLRDSYLEGTIAVGPYAITHPRFGEPVLRHEMGHAISKLFQSQQLSEKSTAWYDRTRQCLARVEGHAATVEEDAADLMARTEAKTNHACHLLRNDPKALTLARSGDDPHSSDFHRVLVFNAALGKSVPVPCARALRERGQSFEDRCAPGPSRTAEAVE